MLAGAQAAAALAEAIDEASSAAVALGLSCTPPERRTDASGTPATAA